MTIDPNGGTVDGAGEAYSLSVKANSDITLPTPEAPEGFELVGWYVGEIGVKDEGWKEPEEGDPNIKDAGASITVDKPLVVTAIWKKVSQ